MSERTGTFFIKNSLLNGILFTPPKIVLATKIPKAGANKFNAVPEIV